MAALKKWSTAKFYGEEWASGGFTLRQRTPHIRAAHGIEYYSEAQRDEMGGTHCLELVYIVSQSGAREDNRRTVLQRLTREEALTLAKAWVSIADPQPE